MGKNGEAEKNSVIFAGFTRPTKIRAVTAETTTEGKPDFYFETPSGNGPVSVWSAGFAAQTRAAHL